MCQTGQSVREGEKMTMNGMKPRGCIEKSEGRLQWEREHADTAKELERLSKIRTQGNPYPHGSDLFEAFERCHSLGSGGFIAGGSASEFRSGKETISFFLKCEQY